MRGDVGKLSPYVILIECAVRIFHRTLRRLVDVEPEVRAAQQILYVVVPRDRPSTSHELRSVDDASLRRVVGADGILILYLHALREYFVVLDRVAWWRSCRIKLQKRGDAVVLDQYFELKVAIMQCLELPVPHQDPIPHPLHALIRCRVVDPDLVGACVEDAIDPEHRVRSRRCVVPLVAARREAGKEKDNEYAYVHVVSFCKSA